MASSVPIIGISSCLLGEPVRYDGDHKRDEALIQSLSAHFELVSFCPEVAIGMGVPRPPIQLVQQDNGIHALAVEDASQDFTARLQQAAAAFQRQHPQLCGYVFKSRSPSCGTGNTRVFDSDSCISETGDGIFAHAWCKLQPHTAIADEIQLKEPRLLQEFINKAQSCFNNKIAK